MSKQNKKDNSDLVEQLEGIIKQSKQYLNRGKDEVLRLGQIAKHNLEIVNFERQQRQIFEKLGTEFFKISAKKEVKLNDINEFAKPLLTKAKQLEGKIKDSRDKIDKLEGNQPKKQKKTTTTKKTTNKNSKK